MKNARTKRSKALIVILSASLLGLLVVTVLYLTPHPIKKLESKEADVVETVFRHLFLNNESGAKQEADVYYLSIEEKDPSDEFLGRFDAHNPVRYHYSSQPPAPGRD